MRRFFALILFALLPGTVSAQGGLLGVVGGPFAPIGGVASPCGTSCRVPWLFAEAKAGYQWMDLNVGIPIPATVLPGPQGEFNMETMDVTLRDGGVWVGGIRLAAQPSEWVRVFAEGFANAQRNAVVTTKFEGDIIVAAAWGGSPWDWTGSHLQWWSLDGGGILGPCTGPQGIVGFRADSTDLHLKDPRNANGSIASQGAPLVAISQDREGDVQTRLYIPYIGIGGNSGYFTWSMLYTPLAWVEFKMPIRWNSAYDFFGSTLVDSSDSRYRVTSSRGNFAEVNLEYFAPVASSTNVSLWLKGNWFRLKGDGHLTSEVEGTPGPGGTTALFGGSGTVDVGNATVSRNLVSGGIAAAVSY